MGIKEALVTAGFIVLGVIVISIFALMVVLVLDAPNAVAAFFVIVSGVLTGDKIKQKTYDRWEPKD
jgi:Na+/H+ antiporter NhaC